LRKKLLKRLMSQKTQGLPLLSHVLLHPRLCRRGPNLFRPINGYRRPPIYCTNTTFYTLLRLIEVRLLLTFFSPVQQTKTPLLRFCMLG
jgi:hypothetical protein